MCRYSRNINYGIYTKNYNNEGVRCKRGKGMVHNSFGENKVKGIITRISAYEMQILYILHRSGYYV